MSKVSIETNLTPTYRKRTLQPPKNRSLQRRDRKKPPASVCPPAEAVRRRELVRHARIETEILVICIHSPVQYRQSSWGTRQFRTTRGSCPLGQVPLFDRRTYGRSDAHCNQPLRFDDPANGSIQSGAASWPALTNFIRLFGISPKSMCLDLTLQGPLPQQKRRSKSNGPIRLRLHLNPHQFELINRMAPGKNPTKKSKHASSFNSSFKPASALAKQDCGDTVC